MLASLTLVVASSTLVFVRLVSGSGIDHLLHGGRGAGGSAGEESDELKTACLMGLISALASVAEVRRISPLHMAKLQNAVAKAIIQRYGRV